jgi:hypothetical protein
MLPALKEWYSRIRGFSNSTIMEPRLKVRLYPEWRQVQDTTALASYVRGDGSNSGRLQFSLAEYQHGKVPDATEKTLIGICEKLTNGVRGRKEMLSRSGKCEFGTYGTVVAMGDFPIRLQVWVLSNERVFILVTHTCEKEPTSQEVTEAEKIALTTGFS